MNAHEGLAGRRGGGRKSAHDAPLGAVIAGGRSSRFGAPKALARIGGRRLIDRVIEALSRVTGDPVLIANDAELADAAGLPARADSIHGLGALGGIHAALCWARELGRPGIVAVACDMPFLEPGLLAEIVTAARARPRPDLVVLPESESRRGIEPLCAYYGVGCIAAIEAAVARGDHRMISFHADVEVVRIPLEIVRRHAHADHAFFNVNTAADRVTAERMLRDLGRVDVR